jgi:NADH-quinone oxidoreductase subunit C
MTDVDIRLGLTPTDLKYREQQVKRPDAWVNLDAENSAEFALLQKSFADEIVKSRFFRDEKTIWVKKEKIVEICRLLRDDQATRYNFLSDVTAVDLLRIKEADQPRFEVVYNLYSLKTFQRLRVKAQVTEDDPTIDTVEGVWPAANWPEREVYDLFGIRFNNHSDLRRIQMPDDWVGHPLRKDFPLGGEVVEFSFNVRER